MTALYCRSRREGPTASPLPVPSPRPDAGELAGARRSHRKERETFCPLKKPVSMARSDHESSGEAPTVPVLSNIEQTAKTRASRLVISQSLYPARRKRPLGKSGPSAGLLSLPLTVSRPCADWREMAGWSSSNSDTVWLLLLRRGRYRRVLPPE